MVPDHLALAAPDHLSRRPLRLDQVEAKVDALAGQMQAAPDDTGADDTGAG